LDVDQEFLPHKAFLERAGAFIKKLKLEDFDLAGPYRFAKAE
jgi:hypothetical protein